MKNKDLKSNNLTYIINEIEYTINKLVLKHSSLKPKFKSKSKSKIDPVTSLDKIIEKSVVKIIEKNFPNHSIIGEEFDQKLGKSEYKWIIDPLDGTKNYILGIPTWSNLVGLQKKNKSILSFANFPMLEKYYLSLGNNSFVKKKKCKLKKIFSNKRVKSLNDAKVAINTFHTIKDKRVFNLMSKFKGIIKITNADAYNFCLLSEGRIDVLIESGLKKVDFFPLLALLRNSGAIITDWYGGNKFQNGQILVTANKILHKEVLKKFRF